MEVTAILEKEILNFKYESYNCENIKGIVMNPKTYRELTAESMEASTLSVNIYLDYSNFRGNKVYCSSDCPEREFKVF